MIILTIRTDKPEAELGLYDNERQLAYYVWPAHRQLAETLHYKIDDLLQSQQKKLEDVQGIVLYKGPGSFTGLRIGAAVAVALATNLPVPIVGTSGEAWIAQGIGALANGASGHQIILDYGSPPHITLPKK